LRGKIVQMERIGRDYEFTSDENAAFSVLAASMNVFSWALLVVGPVLAATGFYTDVLLRLTAMDSHSAFTPVFLMTFLAGVVVTVLGLWIRKAIKAIRQIVQTEGSDLSHLMTAVSQMQLFFRYGGVLAWLLVASLIGLVTWYVLHPPPAGMPEPDFSLLRLPLSC
jgi:type II secretory pathway component PulF